MLDRPHGAHRALREFEHQRRRDGAIGFHEFEKFRKPDIGQRRAGHIAEQTDVAVLQQKPPHHLHAAQRRKMVELRHQRAGFGIGQEIGGGDQIAVVGA